MKENTIHATIAEDTPNHVARQKIQELIEEGILRDAGYSYDPEVYQNQKTGESI